MDFVTLLAGGGLVAAGAVLQRVIPARRRKHGPVKPICGCRHHRSFHANGIGMCSHQSTWSDPCTCSKYVGPEPLPELYAGEYSSE
jgi:hypothetical protein